MAVTATRAGWSRWAETYGAQFAEQQWLLSKYEVAPQAAWPAEKIDLLADLLRDRLQVSAGMRVLELCCGGGWLIGRLAELSVEGAGVDFAPAMIQVARPRWPRVHFVVADAAACPLPEACADAVLCYFALINVESPAVRAGIAAETHRLLRPGARAVIGHLPLRDMSAAYEQAKQRYSERLGVRQEQCPLRTDFQPTVVLFSREELLELGARFSQAHLEPSFNHFWFPGEPVTCPWRADLCLVK